MTEGEFFTYIYPVVPLVGLIGFLPQMITLLKLSDVPKSISLMTWYIWTATWAISFGYAVFALQDGLFALTSGMNLVCHVLIISVTLYKRNRYLAREEAAVLYAAE
ncbi:MAG: hypothetical protein QF692_02015 [Alphaproteobacteria bacterium]|jgi:uncharacterized protein with PQ loop repeat|nr:hypothetical protein [Alphaproteobacteria bacterium]MDP7222019.1 hypothetical protein [Alphaproteobacteria bacterium]